jgi:hypothetical protein
MHQIDHCVGSHLGNTGIKVSTSAKTGKKVSKYALLRQVQTVFDGSRFAVTSCQKVIGGGVQVMRSGDGAYFDGIITCKSIWICPVCAQRIISQRLDDLKDALGSGYKAVMVTATLRHDPSDRLCDLLRSLKDAIRKLKSGRWWGDYKDRHGVVAYVSSYEITPGVYGWHPHVHMLLFLDRDHPDVDLMWSEIVSRYIYLVDRGGGYASRHHAVDVTRAGSDAGQYLVKHVFVDDGLVSEMGSTNTKDGRGSGSKTFWDLVFLSKYFSYAVDLVKEYANATYRLQSFIWSRGAKDLFGIKDQKDCDDADPIPVANITRPVWTVIHTHALQDHVLQLAVLDGDQLKDYLGGLTGRS